MASGTNDGDNAAPVPVVLAIDPGRDKCGIAVVSAAGESLEQLICARREVAESLTPLLAKYGVGVIVLGHATTSRALHQELQQRLPHIQIHIIDETGSTLQARDEYWRAHPPRGWRRLLPLSLQTPPRAVDDFAAIVLAQRFFERQK